MKTPIPASMQLNYVRRDEDRFFFALNLDLGGPNDPVFSCEVATEAYENPVMNGSRMDHLSLPDTVAERFVEALAERLIAYMDPTDDTTGIQLDVTDMWPWLELTFYRQTASCLYRSMLIAAPVRSTIQITKPRVIVRIG